MQKVEPGDPVIARDSYGAGGQFFGILLSLQPVFNDKGAFLGNTATVLDTTFPEHAGQKTAVSWQLDTSVPKQDALATLAKHGIKV